MAHSVDLPVADDSPAESIAITLLAKRRLVEIRWSDGHVSNYSFNRLRWGCSR